MTALFGSWLLKSNIVSKIQQNITLLEYTVYIAVGTTPMNTFTALYETCMYTSKYVSTVCKKIQLQYITHCSCVRNLRIKLAEVMAVKMKAVSAWDEP